MNGQLSYAEQEQGEHAFRLTMTMIVNQINQALPLPLQTILINFKINDDYHLAYFY